MPVFRPRALLSTSLSTNRSQPLRHRLPHTTTNLFRHQSTNPARQTPPNATSTKQAQTPNQRDSESDTTSTHAAQQDRTHLNPQATEYSKTGTDNAVADLSAISFSPDSSPSSSPEDAKNAASTNASNPLEVSPANRKVSETTPEGRERGEGEVYARDLDVEGDGKQGGGGKGKKQGWHGDSGMKGKAVLGGREGEFKGFDRRKEEDKGRGSFRPGKR